jgi:hypothetical protein
MSTLILDHPSLRLNLPARPGNPIDGEALHIIIIQSVFRAAAQRTIASERFAQRWDAPVR